jgi:hypothetical protein
MVVGFFWQKSKVGWWLISQVNRALTPLVHFDGYLYLVQSIAINLMAKI